jgi:hypothetical protein
MWPVFLEWGASGWYRHAEVMKLINNDVVKALATRAVFLYDPDRLTRVFKGVEVSKFSDITHAIEMRVSSYDDDNEAEEDSDDGTT